MNAEKMNDLCVFGAYVRGTFDTATSRGILTQQNIATMVKSLIGLYGEDQFSIQSVELDAPTTPLTPVAQAAAKTIKKSRAAVKKIKRQVHSV